MHKQDNGITMHDPKKCIGCRYCMYNCPYEVIYFNWQDPHKFWKDSRAVIKDGTMSPREMAEKVNGGKRAPYSNPERAQTLPETRPKGVVEKCTFCDHRIKAGKIPYCVVACPADARIFGDLEQSDSKVNKLLGKYKPYRLKERLGTQPNVYYIRSFNPAHYKRTKGGI
jgi:molybdopterin-containing oxidoreductase family iron-sulfur binding subunit